jgi:hypothetical protein
MGYEHAVFNHTTKTWYELGRGPWYNLGIREPLLNMASEVLVEAQCELRDDPREWATYLIWVCCKVYSFVRSGKDESGPVDVPLGDVECFSNAGPPQDRWFRLSKEYEQIEIRSSTSARRGEISRWLSDEDFELLMSEVSTS